MLNSNSSRLLSAIVLFLLALANQANSAHYDVLIYVKPDKGSGDIVFAVNTANLFWELDESKKMALFIDETGKKSGAFNPKGTMDSSIDIIASKTLDNITADTVVIAPYTSSVTKAKDVFSETKAKEKIIMTEYGQRQKRWSMLLTREDDKWFNENGENWKNLGVTFVFTGLNGKGVYLIPKKKLMK